MGLGFFVLYPWFGMGNFWCVCAFDIFWEIDM
jgi:hypothetical protein